MRLAALDELARRWGEVEPILVRATLRSHGCYLPIDVLRAAAAGQMGVWLVETRGELRAVIVTEIRAYPRRRALEVVFIAGAGAAALREAVIDTLDRHARAMGCDHIRGAGRIGWLRFGFAAIGTVMARNVSGDVIEPA